MVDNNFELNFRPSLYLAGAGFLVVFGLSSWVFFYEGGLWEFIGGVLVGLAVVWALIANIPKRIRVEGDVVYLEMVWGGEVSRNIDHSFQVDPSRIAFNISNKRRIYLEKSDCGRFDELYSVMNGKVSEFKSKMHPEEMQNLLRKKRLEGAIVFIGMFAIIVFVGNNNISFPLEFWDVLRRIFGCALALAMLGFLYWNGVHRNK